MSQFFHETRWSQWHFKVAITLLQVAIFQIVEDLTILTDKNSDFGSYFHTKGNFFALGRLMIVLLFVMCFI